jgi:hypothetical protein
VVVQVDRGPATGIQQAVAKAADQKKLIPDRLRCQQLGGDRLNLLGDVAGSFSMSPNIAEMLYLATRDAILSPLTVRNGMNSVLQDARTLQASYT